MFTSINPATGETIATYPELVADGIEHIGLLHHRRVALEARQHVFRGIRHREPDRCAHVLPA